MNSGNIPAKTNVVRILKDGKNPVGGGVAISDTIVITCAHVVADALSFDSLPKDKPNNTIYLDFPLVNPNKSYRAIVSEWEPIHDDGTGDVAILHVEGVNHISRVFLDSEINWDEPFRIMGFPKGFNTGVWSFGKIQAETGIGWLQIETTSGKSIEFGYSGSGVWKSDFKSLIGILVASDKKIGSPVSFLIPVNILSNSFPELLKYQLPSISHLGDLVCLKDSELGDILDKHRNITKDSKNRSQFLLGLSLVMLRLGFFPQALKVLQQFNQMEPLHSYGWYLTSLALSQGKSPNEAIRTNALAMNKCVERAIDIDHGQSHFYIWAASIKQEYFLAHGFDAPSRPYLECINLATTSNHTIAELNALKKLGVIRSREINSILDNLCQGE